jgi:hypothetical protein
MGILKISFTATRGGCRAVAGARADAPAARRDKFALSLRSGYFGASAHRPVMGPKASAPLIFLITL